MLKLRAECKRSAAAAPDIGQDALCSVPAYRSWSEGAIDHVRHRLDRLHGSAPQDDFQENALAGLRLEVHIEDEVAQRVHNCSGAGRFKPLHPMRMPTYH